MVYSPILILGLLMVTGLTFNLVTNRVGIPRIAAYALAGLVWSPELLGSQFDLNVGNWSKPLTDISLAIVAYIIGGSMTVKQLSKLGKSILFCTFGEVLGTICFVTVAVFWLFSEGSTQGLMFALILGVLAASTDAAATVAVVHEYRTKGDLTTTLLGIAALDDAIGILLFSVLLVWLTGTGLSSHIMDAGVEIFGALVLGAIAGYLLAASGHLLRNRNFFLPMVLSALFLTQGMAEYWHVSPLLTAMMMGFVARATFISGGERLFASVEYLEELVFLIFFTLAGTHFKLSIFTETLNLLMIYAFARILGKIIGANIGGWLASAPKAVRKYAGLGVIPQAGIAIGLSLNLMDFPAFNHSAVLVLNLILASTLIFEVIGPFASRYALQRAGELIKEGRP